MIYYTILIKTDLTQSILDKVLQDNPFSLRTSLDGTKVILKFAYNDIPLEVSILGYSLYTQAEIQNIIYTSGDWE